MHIFARITVGNEGDDATVAVIGNGQSRFLPNLTEHTVLGALSVFEMTADSDPFIVVDVILFLGAVKHQIATVSFGVA